MKKILKIVWFAVAAIALFGVLAWLSLFLAWSRLIEAGTGITVAAIIGIIFFISNTVKIIKNKEAPTDTEKRKRSFLRIIFSFLIFLLPFYILSFYFVPKFYKWSGTDVELYRYHNFPCENSTFTTNDKMVMYNDTSRIIPQSAYPITHNLLLKDKLDPHIDSNKNVIVKKGTKFKVIGFYLPKYRKYSGMYYYLIENLDENKTKAWVFNLDFDAEKCRPEFNKFDIKHFSPERGTYEEEKIDLKNITKQSSRIKEHE